MSASETFVSRHPTPMLSFHFYIYSYLTEILSPTEATKLDDVKSVDRAAKLKLVSSCLTPLGH